MSLYIPFCGNVEILPSEWYGHLMSIKLVVDLITGNCLGCVFKDNSFQFAKEGSCGVDVPITFQMKNTYKDALINEQLSYAKTKEKQSIISSTLGGLKPVGQMASGVANVT